MHSPDASDGVVEAFVLEGGVLRYTASHGSAGTLRCRVGALRRALDALGPTATVVTFAPHGADAPLTSGRLAGAAVTAVPVTDAVKRVAGGRLVRTVDRTALRYLAGPAAVERVALERLVADKLDDDIVAPLAVEPLRRL